MGYPQNPAPGYGTPNYPPAQPGYGQPPPPPQPGYGAGYSYSPTPPGYGQQYPAPPPPPAPRVTGKDFLDQPTSGEGKSLNGWIGSQPIGTSLTGVIHRDINPDADVRPQKKFRSEEYDTYKDGRVKSNLTIPLQLMQPYPPDVFTDGRATFIISINDYRNELLPAMEAAGVPKNPDGTMPWPEKGALLTVTFAEERQIQGFGMPKKVKHLTYQRPQGAQNGQAPVQATQSPAPAAENPYSAPQQPQYTQPAPTWQQPQPQYTQPAPPSAPQYQQQGPLPTQAGAPPYQGVPPQPMQQPPAPAANGPQPVPETATDLFNRLKQGQQQAPPQG